MEDNDLDYAKYIIRRLFMPAFNIQLNGESIGSGNNMGTYLVS